MDKPLVESEVDPSDEKVTSKPNRVAKSAREATKHDKKGQKDDDR